MCEPSPQRTPVLVQAGSSPRGVSFAARHAEAQFVGFQNPSIARESVAAVRSATAEHGRHPDDVKLLQAISVIVAETEHEARLKYERFMEYANVEGALALFGGWTGIDLSGYAPDDEISAFESQGMQYLATFFRAIDDHTWTFAEMCEYIKLASISNLLVGTPKQVADELERWMDEADLDGFNIIPIVQPGSFVDFVDLVVPELQKRGRMHTDYDGTTTLREGFFGPGETRLRTRHPGSPTQRSVAAGLQPTDHPH
jgi:alkanesulfonate monooxygenase SsuD/methylene tetrahydromethanopterin reductase-like flavin-dependent oxidoreductase (luciferase family)